MPNVAARSLVRRLNAIAAILLGAVGGGIGAFEYGVAQFAVAPGGHAKAGRLMILKKTAASKRTAPPRTSDSAKTFKKDWTRLSHSRRYDLNLLKQAMLLIANDGPLPPEWLDHALKGEWSDHRECHIGGDFLLIYREKADCVIFVRAGTHAELFGH